MCLTKKLLVRKTILISIACCPFVLGIFWYTAHIFFFGHTPGATTPPQENNEKYETLKQQVGEKNSAVSSGDRENCKHISDTRLRSDCSDHYIQMDALKSPSKAKEICATLSAQHNRDSCVSATLYRDIMAPSEEGNQGFEEIALSCRAFPDEIWRSSCVKEKELALLTTLEKSKKLNTELCTKITTERLRSYCLKQTNK